MKRFSGAIAVAAVLAAVALHANAATDRNAACSPYFHEACSEAMGRWLPRLPNTTIVGTSGFKATPTKIEDYLVDPSGNGTLFVYGTAGPPKGHAVYDPIHRIAYYDEGCCSWHHTALVASAPPPPKHIAARSLLAMRTARGIALGDAIAKVRAIFGYAPAHAVMGKPAETTLSYVRTMTFPKPDTPCPETTTFLFTSNTLRAMDFDMGC